MQAETAQFTEDREQIQTNKTDIADLRQTKAGAIVESANGETIVVRDSSDNFFEDFRVLGKSEQGGNPSPDNKQDITNIGKNGSVGIKVRGKNLIQYPYVQSDKYDPMYNAKAGSVINIDGITITVLEDRGLKIVGTATTDTYINVMRDKVLVNKNDVKYSKDLSHDINNGLIFYLVKKDETINKIVYPQAEIGETVTEYEPYKEPQTITLQTQNGLPGLQVASGGNYTDSSGQQWICNEIDFKRGEYIQRIKKDALDKYDYAIQSVNEHGIVNFMTSLADSINGENKILCTHLTEDTTLIAQTTNEGIFLVNTTLYIRIKQERFDTVQKLKEWLKTNNVVVYYTLETPIKTELTQEEIEAYKKLHTYYPTTVMSNSEDCEMEVEYVADTKNYIDNKISANVASIISQYQTNVANLLSLMPLETQATMIANDTNNILENVEEMKHE